jgi:hypothetical protein
VLHHSVGKIAIRRDRESVYLNDLSEIDVPRAFIGKPDVGDLKVSAITEVRRDFKAPNVYYTHSAEH